MKSSHLSRLTRPLLFAMAVAVAFGACDEQLDSGFACPTLCPQEDKFVTDTTFFAVDLDSSIAGFPTIGSETQLFVATLGDTLDTRAVVRYDSLPILFQYTNSPDDQPLVALDSAYLKITVVTDTLGAPTTIEAYDVGMDGPDDADPTLAAQGFTPDRLLGSQTYTADQMKDSIFLQIDKDKVLSRAYEEAGKNRLRVGLRVVPGGGNKTSFTMLTSNSGRPMELRLRPPGDSTAPLLRIFPESKADDETYIKSEIEDYLLVVTAPAEPPPDVDRVGGIFGRRLYLRFAIPNDILDSSSVVRATLYLTQKPNLGAVQPFDTVGIQHLGVVASGPVTDLSRALLLVSKIQQEDSVHLVAADSGERTFEMITLVRSWRGTKPEDAPRALALRSTGEGENARSIDFFSIEAPPEVRPRLRLTYVRRRKEGLP